MTINVTKTELPPESEYKKYLHSLWKSAWITNQGKYHTELERKLKVFLDLNQLSLVTNGTLAIQLAVRALKLKGEVITTPYTFAATTTALLWEGLTPVFADIDSQTFNLSPLEAEKKITKNTSAILAVHVYGNPCDVEDFEKLGKKYNIKILYDAAHAFGVKIHNKTILHYGDASMLSFHATKVFNTIEGGAVVSSKKIIDIVNLLKNFGIVNATTVTTAGINAKMNEFQAIMGLCNLKYVKKKIALRKKIYERYVKNLRNEAKIKFQDIKASYYNYAYMPTVFPNKKIRESVANTLEKNNIIPRRYFYPLITNMEFYKNKQQKDFKIAEQISNGILCLPIYSTLTLKQVDLICNIILREIKRES